MDERNQSSQSLAWPVSSAVPRPCTISNSNNHGLPTITLINTVTFTCGYLNRILFLFYQQAGLSEHNPEDVVYKKLKDRRRVGGLPMPYPVDLLLINGLRTEYGSQ